MSCVVCSDDQPCLFDVLADPGATIFARSPTSNCRLLCTFDMPSVCGCHSGDQKFGEADACSCCIHEKDSRQLLAVRASAVAGEFGLLQLQFRSSCEVARIPRTRLHSKDIDLNELRFEVNGKHCTKPMQAKTPSVYFLPRSTVFKRPAGVWVVRLQCM